MTSSALWLACLSITQAAAPVEGDLEALQVVRGAQASNSKAFPLGSAKFRAVHIYSSNSPMSQERVTWWGTVVWEGPNSYLDYQQEKARRPLGGEWEPRQAPHGIREIRTLQSKFFYSHTVTLKRASLTYRDLTRWSYDLTVTPRAVWYGPYQSTRDWATLLDPTFNAENTHKMIVERRSADEILVTRETVSGASLVITCSLASGGNIVRVEMSNPRDLPEGRTVVVDTHQYQWVPLEDGRFRLKRLEYTVTRTDRDEPHYSYVLEIEEFNPDAAIPADRFTLESLHIAPWTEVNEERNRVRRSYEFGTVPLSNPDAPD